MEFHIQWTGALPDGAALEGVIRQEDPAALVDIVRESATVRIASSCTAAGLAALLARAGHAITAAQVVQQPSVCCGGCSG